jgi:hypothetical protein
MHRAAVLLPSERMDTAFVARLALVGLSLAACSPRVTPTDALSSDALSADSAEVALARDAAAIDDAHDDSAADALVSDTLVSDTLIADAVAADVGDRDAEDAGPSAPFVPPDFSLPDLNSNSPTHRMDVSPRAQRGRVTAWYFGTAT